MVTATTSVVMGIDKSLGEDELLQQFKTVLQSLTPHLTDDLRNRLWVLIQTYKKTWIRPRYGQFKCSEATTVRTRPCSSFIAILRHTVEICPIFWHL